MTRGSLMARSPSPGAAEYTALTDALTHYQPPCTEDDRYTADQHDDATLAELATGCDLCHISGLCRAYAIAAKPTAGYWAGRLCTPSTTGKKAAQ